MARSIKNGIDSIAASLQKGLTFLGSTGAVAPFVGLFGTVWGIYHALISISSSGSAQLDQVAGPIGEALIMTALGLAVAIPAVLGFNALNRANKLLVAELNRFGNDLLAYFVTGARVKSGE
jgi:biopolymer transport protein ExbB